MNEVQNFINEQFGEIRTITKNNTIYFIASDIAKNLGYKQPNKAITRHCRYSTKHTIATKQGNSCEMLVIPEGDVYRLVGGSKLDTAIQFEKWIFDELLPTIRKNDYYVSTNISEENYNKLVKELEQKSIWLRGAFGDKVVKIDKVARDLNIPKQSIEHYIKKNKWIDSKGNITKIGARGKILNKDGTIYFGETGMKLICAAIARQKDKQLIDNCLTNGTNIKKI